jgi:xanthine dehydrogenase accessory factor
MSFDLQALRDLVARHGRVARIVIADFKGSAPRETGTAMYVWDGGQSGTIGGGALEFEAVERAFDGPALRHIPLGPALGQCCGGQVSLVTEVFEKTDLEAIVESDFYTRRVAGSSEKPLKIVASERAMRNASGGVTTLEGGWLCEPLSSARRPLWIYGAGHVGRALIDVLEPLPDFEITWVDTARARFPSEIPDAVEAVSATDPTRLIPHAPKDAHHLIVTYSHALDLDICHALLCHGFAFAGLIGSATKWARFRNRLGQLGHHAAEINAITCPIGDPSLGKHPQAIAVGVASTLLRARRRKTLGEDIAL